MITVFSFLCTGNHEKKKHQCLFIHTLHTLCGEATRRKRRKINSFIHTCCILKQIANLLLQTKHKTNLKTVCLKTPKLNFIHWEFLRVNQAIQKQPCKLSWKFKNRRWMERNWKFGITAPQSRSSFAFELNFLELWMREDWRRFNSKLESAADKLRSTKIPPPNILISFFFPYPFFISFHFQHQTLELSDCLLFHYLLPI